MALSGGGQEPGALAAKRCSPQQRRIEPIRAQLVIWTDCAFKLTLSSILILTYFSDLRTPLPPPIRLSPLAIRYSTCMF